MILIAQPNSSQRLVYRLARTDQIDGWWGWLLVCVIAAAVLIWVVRLYRRDTAELSRGLASALATLRVVAWLGLLLFFLGLERRTEQAVERPSEVVVLVDTSQSMGLSSGPSNPVSRQAAAVEVLQRSPLLDRFAEDHRLSVYRFDATQELVPLMVGGVSSAATAMATPVSMTPTPAARWTAWGALLGLGIAAALLVFVAVLALARSTAIERGTLIWVAVYCAVCGATAWGIVRTRWAPLSYPELLRGSRSLEQSPQPTEPLPDRAAPTSAQRVDWLAATEPVGPQTRFGDALRLAMLRHDPVTLAAVVVLTDGQNTSGAAPEGVIELYERNEIPLYLIGFGDSRPPSGVSLVDLDVPRRVYPGDQFEVTALVQATGLAGQSVRIDLFDNPADQDVPSQATDTQTVAMPADGELLAVRFQVTPEEAGQRRITVRVVDPPQDQNVDDNQRDARVEVVARRTRVLLLAGAPTREYQFVRGQLFRDSSFQSDVLVQSGQPGISQEANEVLTDFPRDAADLFAYDVIVAFDPDWLAFDATQIALLDRWVAEQAGGLIFVAGPVNMSRWTRVRSDPRAETIKALIPVQLTSRAGLSLDSGRFDGQSSWPLEFTAEASKADFLSLADDPQQPLAAWNEFAGVFGYYGSREAKPAARVYARFSDPSTSIDGQQPVYLASQFYGAGRTYFQASGEIWRMRGVNETYTENYWTKLIRWAGESRLQRDSPRGVLLIEKPVVETGDTVVVRAVLTDEQYRPLQAPSVDIQVLEPDGRSQSLTLRRQANEPREGTFTGQLTLRKPGEHVLELRLGSLTSEAVLRQLIEARVPALELERPGRNDAVLGQLATRSGGLFLPFSEDTSGPVAAILQAVQPRPLQTVLPGTIDRSFQEALLGSLMWIVGGELVLEWLLRRLHRLA